MTKENKICILCGKKYKGWGNNAEPVKKGRCCDKCNDTKVIPERIKRAKPEVIKTVKTIREAKDVKGIGIPKGTVLYVIQEGPVAPFGDHHRLLVVRVDNGTGDLNLMPETAIRDTEVPFKKSIGNLK